MSLPKTLNIIPCIPVMKFFLPLTLLTCCLTAQIYAEVENEIPYGIEAVTGFRSEYVYRGFNLAEDSVLDFQIEAEIAINDQTYLNVGGWYATETGDNDFSESAIFTKLSFEQSDQLTLGVDVSYRDFNESFFDSGIDFGIFASWQFNEDFGLSTGASYDTGADGFYAYLEGNWSKTLSDDAFVSLKTGVSYVSDYYERNGINDIYIRLSLTYHISETVSVTPFVGTSILIEDDSTFPGVINDDTTYAGLWFVVRF